MKLTLMIEGSAAVIAAATEAAENARRAEQPEPGPRMTMIGKGTEEGRLVPIENDDSPVMPEIAQQNTFSIEGAVTGDDVKALLSEPTVAPVPPMPTMPNLSTAPVDIDIDDEPASTDSTGLPWDARIHADSRATNADGSWRKRRGVDDDTVAEVTAELRGEPAPEPRAPVQQPEPATPTPLPFPMPNAAAPVQSAGGISFAEFMQTLSQKMIGGAISTEQLQGVVQQVSGQTGTFYNAVTDFKDDQAAIDVAVSLLRSMSLWD